MMQLQKNKSLFVSVVILSIILISILNFMAIEKNVTGSQGETSFVNEIDTINRNIDSTTKLTDTRSVIGAQWLLDNGLTGENVRIGIIDSGVTDPSSEYGTRFISAKSFVTTDNGYSKDDLSLTDYYNHGTRVARFALGADYGIAPSAELVSAKIFGDNSVIAHGGYDGEETTQAIVDAVLYCAEQNVSIINLSIGQYSNIVNDGRQYIIDKISKEKNIVFTISAGNEGNGGVDGGTIGSPGTSFQAITVGSTDLSGTYMEYFSGSGFRVDYTVKPDVVVPGPGGTSFASPVVAGGVALLIQALKDNNLDYTPGAIKAALLESANPVDSYPIWYQGAGLVNLTAAYELLINAPLKNNIPNIITVFPHKLPVSPLDVLFREQRVGLNLTVITPTAELGTASITGIPSTFFSYTIEQVYNQSSRLNFFFTPPSDAELTSYSGTLSISFPSGIVKTIDLEFTVKQPRIKILFDETRNAFHNVLKPSNDYGFQDPWGDTAFLMGAFREFYQLMAENNISVTPFQLGEFNLSYLENFDILLLPHPFTKLTNIFSDWWNDPFYGQTFTLENDNLKFSANELQAIKNYVDQNHGSILFLGSDPRMVNTSIVNDFFDYFDLGISSTDQFVLTGKVPISSSPHQIFSEISSLDYYGSKYSVTTTKPNVTSYFDGRFITLDNGPNKGRIFVSGSSYFAENFMLNSLYSNSDNNCKFTLNTIEWLNFEPASLTTTTDSNPNSSSTNPTNEASETTCSPTIIPSTTATFSGSNSETSSSTDPSNSPGFSIFYFSIILFALAAVKKKRRNIK